MLRHYPCLAKVTFGAGHLLALPQALIGLVRAYAHDNHGCDVLFTAIGVLLACYAISKGYETALTYHYRGWYAPKKRSPPSNGDRADVTVLEQAHKG
jgi:hypothetical protein